MSKVPSHRAALTSSSDLSEAYLAPKVRVGVTLVSYLDSFLNRRKPETERRKWPRLPLAIPIFVRSHDGVGKELLEFATALNVSGGGMLVAVRRSLPPSTQVSLEIPSAPLATINSLPKASRTLRARVIRSSYAEGYHLVGLKLSRPLVEPGPDRLPKRRKVASSV